jgi:hypothetical protein
MLRNWRHPHQVGIDQLDMLYNLFDRLNWYKKKKRRVRKQMTINTKKTVQTRSIFLLSTMPKRTKKAFFTSYTVQMDSFYTNVND